MSLPIALILSQLMGCATASGETTGTELLERVIAYHDPDGHWPQFQGRVQIMTTYPRGDRVDEILEVDRPADFYQSIRFAGDVRPVKGVRQGECFRLVNDDPDPTPEDITRFRIDCENALWYREHHSGHSGLPMTLRESGVQVEPGVSMESVQGRQRYALRLVGRPDAVKHPYYAGSRVLYIDLETHAVRGVGAIIGDGTTEMFCNFEGELEVGGIRMAQVQTCYRNGSFNHVSVFSFAQ